MSLLKQILQFFLIISFWFTCTGTHVEQFCQVKEGTYGFCLPYFTCRAKYSQPLMDPFLWTACGITVLHKMTVCCPYMKIDDCGLPYSSIVTRITQGEFVMDSSWPWMVALGVIKDSKRHPQFLCGGTLISPKHVLTAAHCAKHGINMIRTGNYNLAHPSVMDIAVKHVHIHPTYSVTNNEADIAILELRHTYNASWHIRPICLPGGSLANHAEPFGSPNQTVYVAGWGATMFGGIMQKRLRMVELNIVDLMVCNATYYSRFTSKFPEGVNTKTLCAVDLKPRNHDLAGDACLGDSGGPLIYRNPDSGRSTVIGIVAKGHGCGLPGLPGLYTRVKDFLPWIAHTMAG